MATDLKRLYDFNHQLEQWEIREYAPSVRKKEQESWNPGGRTRRLLQAVYTIAFACLLRFDEALKIQAQDISTFKDPVHGFVLTLPFRKTDQQGGEHSSI